MPAGRGWQTANPFRCREGAYGFERDADAFFLAPGDAAGQVIALGRQGEPGRASPACSKPRLVPATDKDKRREICNMAARCERDGGWPRQ
jgi:hypothetical protein